jgi:hypothetical protein
MGMDHVLQSIVKRIEHFLIKQTSSSYLELSSATIYNYGPKEIFPEQIDDKYDLTINICLSKAGEFRDGELTFKLNDKRISVPRKQGNAILYPSTYICRNEKSEGEKMCLVIKARVLQTFHKFLQLPKDVHLLIFQCLCPEDVGSLAITCKKMFEISKHDPIWNRLLQEFHPDKLPSPDPLHAFISAQKEYFKPIARDAIMIVNAVYQEETFMIPSKLDIEQCTQSNHQH